VDPAIIAVQIVRAPPRPPHLRPFARAKSRRVLGPNRWTMAPVRLSPGNPADAVRPAVDFAVDFARPSVHGKDRVREIILRLTEGTTPIPKLAAEFAISASRVHSIAKEAVGKGLLDKVPGVRPNTYRPGPNLLRRVLNPSTAASAATLKSPPMRHRAFTLRAHALQVALSVLNLDRADLSAWTAGRPSPAGRTHSFDAGGLKMQLRGRSMLVVSVPPLSLEVAVDALGEAEACIRSYVSEHVDVARKVARERYRVVAGSPGRWYRPPHFALERYPGVPEGVGYMASFWVDSSLGPAEVEASNLRTIEALMAAGNDISRNLSMSTF